MYWRPIALALKEAGFFVSVVNAMLIHDFSDNSIRKIKTDRADSLKIANYALTFWLYWIRPSPVQISCSTNSAPRQDTSNGWILCGDFGIKIAWLPRLFLLLQTPSKNGAKEPDTTTLFRMPNGFMVLPATRLPRLLRMIAPSCSLRKL